ncbi:NADH-quinone oxidoreductase subunit NuoE [Sediminimonas sp.]|uniref:NADH-quinone oxidoreductase subunit NuoE n=1 Tax=Sediminimonas sp. TaxID=2823379 RepID=UPI0025EEC081|nr:NADH-quinone oxidoreductase subunit NuoE [Sediminimonas sp.]
MLRRLHHDQPDSFAFTPDNLTWAEAQITKYPEGRQASAVIPLLWRAQEQEGWLSRPAIEYVADMLGMDYIRALEVATFYFMFQLSPVGAVAHVQVCGTTPCMLCGSENLVAVCREKIAASPHEISADGKLSWEEVECLGACANAPMAQIGKDYYEDLTAESLAHILDELVAGRVPVPGPQAGRYASEPASGLTSLRDHEAGRAPHNASVARALDLGDTVKRIDGSEVPVTAPWLGKGSAPSGKADAPPPKRAATAPAAGPAVPESGTGTKPALLERPREGGADDLKQIKGVGPKLEKLLNENGIYHLDQVAGWSADEVAWADENLVGFKGRASRDDWVGQARKLTRGE